MIEIVRVTLDDIDELQKVGRQTFYETFASENSEENMNEYLASGFSLEKLSSELLDPNSEFYFAKKNSKVIGYLKLNLGESQTELKDSKATEIERIYVLKEMQGQSVGQKLFTVALAVAQENNSAYVWLGVWEKNLKAISFYKKNGFQEFDKHIFKLGDDEQIDIMMRLYLENINL